ncbi:MAG: radical SAM protein [Candidatus Methylomirabilales bacterium]
MQFALGLGLTNECNLACPHCYRDTNGLQRLTLAEVRAILDRLPVASANLGTGENGLHPEFLPIVEALQAAGIKVSLTSNGLSVARLPMALLKGFHEIEFSFDHATPAGQDAFRGPGAWGMAMRSLERARELGVEVTVLAVMMATNYAELPAIGRLARSLGANFRVNVYQPVRTDRYTLSYEQFWEGFRRTLAEFPLLSTSEPVLRGVLGLPEGGGCGCGRRTVRVTPGGRVLPCVYWPAAGEPLARLLELGAAILDAPDFRACRGAAATCAACAPGQGCRGGCAGRRALAGRLAGPDPLCPFARGETLRLDFQLAPHRELVKVGSACTTVFATR